MNEINGLLILPPGKCQELIDTTVNYDEKYDLCVAKKHKKKVPVITYQVNKNSWYHYQKHKTYYLYLYDAGFLIIGLMFILNRLINQVILTKSMREDIMKKNQRNSFIVEMVRVKEILGHPYGNGSQMTWVKFIQSLLVL